MLLRLRSTIFAVGYLFTGFVYGLLSLFLWVLPPLVRHRILISWCWLIVNWVRLVCGIRYEIRGLENMHKVAGPKVVLSKHQSTWETLALQHLCFPASTILKRELLNIPFFGWGLRCLQPIGIDRDNPRDALRQVKIQGVQRLQAGLNVLLFPEGTRVAPGTRGKYARSGPEIAMEAGVPIIPVAVNAGYCWPPKSWMRYPGVVTVVFGEPIDPAGRTSRELIIQVEDWIEGELERLGDGSDKAKRAVAVSAQD
jgi:1-acyl-sn-glycerol-3-phosphate acyltransferase